MVRELRSRPPANGNSNQLIDPQPGEQAKAGAHATWMPPLLIIAGLQRELLCTVLNAQTKPLEDEQYRKARDFQGSSRIRKRVQKQILKPRPFETAKETLREPTTSVAPSKRNTPTAAASPTSPSTHPASPASTIPSPPPEPFQPPSSKTESRTDPNLLTENDLPPPFLSKPSPPPTPSTFPDTASYLLATSFAPIPPPHAFITPLTSHLPSLRSTETLLALAQNTFDALKVWQDEYLSLDAKTAPYIQPPKKPATGGRVLVDQDAWEAAKEADAALWRKGLNAEASRRDGSHLSMLNFNEHVVDGRGLRKRRFDAGLLDGLKLSESDAGAAKEKRDRKPVKRFDMGSNGESPRKRRPHDVDGRSPLKKSRGGGRRIEVLRYGHRIDFLQPTPEESGAGTDDDGYNTTPFQPWLGHTPGGRSYGTGSTWSHRGGTNSAPNGRPPSLVSNDPGGYRPAYTNTLGTSEGANTAKRRQRAKSDKRSESMTAWWAARKKKAAEEKIKELRAQGVLAAEEGIVC